MGRMQLGNGGNGGGGARILHRVANERANTSARCERKRSACLVGFVQKCFKGPSVGLSFFFVRAI